MRAHHKRLFTALFTFFFIVTVFVQQCVLPVQAATAFVALRHSRMIISHAASGTDPILVLFTPNTVGTESTVGIVFQAGYTVDSTASNITVTTTGIPATLKGTSITAWPGVGTTATAVSGNNVTIASSDLTVNTLYGFYITGGITNPASTGQKISVVSTHSDGTPDFSGYVDKVDKYSTAVYIVSDNGASVDADQFVISARVTPTYTFTLNSNSILLDTAVASIEYPGTALNTGVSPVTVTVTTNANNGHVIWLKSSASGGLSSATTATSIAFAGTAADATPTSLSAGTEGVVIDVDENLDTSGSLAVTAEFNGATTSAGGTPSTTFQEIATATGPVDVAGDKVNIIPRVAISGVTLSADDYTQTFTVIGAANI